MKILFYVNGPTQLASTRIRVLQYLPYMHKTGVKTRVITANPYFFTKSRNPIVRIGQIIHIQINLLFFFLRSIALKNIFLQKVFPPTYMMFILKALNKTIIYDFDDAIYLTPENKLRKSKKIRRLNYILKKASLIIVASELNAEYSKKYNSNIIIISGPIECNRYVPNKNKKGKKKITIGWIGSPGTSLYLNLVEEVIENLQKKYNEQIEFLFIGTDKNYNIKQQVRTEDWDIDTELNLLSKFDIGIMPLPDDLWSNGKGGYKLLQYMALGIPSVASAVGINSSIVTHDENGYLATSTDEWVHYLEELINNEEKRRTFGENARQYALSNYSYERYTEILLDKIREIA